MTIARKKLIEVALPLEAINKASAREKSMRHGHPSTLHLWWARRPLAAARAVIFAQMVDDPTTYVDVLREDPKLRRKGESVLKARMNVWEEARALAEKAKGSGIGVPEPGAMPTLDEVLADKERQRLFQIMENLVLWENTNNETVIREAQDEIWSSWRRACADNAGNIDAKKLFNRHELPAFHDPFAGGGALPLEAQRLGLEANASDLNPVAVLINKAMIEIPSRFAGSSPINPKSRSKIGGRTGSWRGAAGLADDVHYYGQWMRNEAEKRIGHLYPMVEVTTTMAEDRPDLEPLVGRKFTVIAWLWARTVKSPNPAFRTVDVPLASTFTISTKVGKEAYVEPVILNDDYHFAVKIGKPKNPKTATGTKLARGTFACAMSGTPITGDYIKQEGKAGRMGARLMAIVAEGERGRLYLTPTPEQEAAARAEKPAWQPEGQIATRMTGGNCTPYGFTSWGDLFTDRQLVALTTLSDLVMEVRALAKNDAVSAGMTDDGKGLDKGGSTATAYGDALAVYLSFLVNQIANHSSSMCGWNSANTQMRSVFARQGIPMVWDYAESNPFSDSSGSYNNLFERQVKGLMALAGGVPGFASQADANSQRISVGRVISTDPPYYDNIGYADLSDFFYVWLRRSQRLLFPELFSTLAVPKAEELVASAHRHGSKQKAESFFLEGMTEAMRRLAEQSHPAFPVTIYYAFKQSENDGDEGNSSTGWDTFVGAVIRAGFAISGTWPIRTEKQGRVIGNDSNALSSSIVLVCRPRSANTPTASRREFVTALKAELPTAVAHLQRGNIAPVDLAQAAIGPGMAVFTRYSKVLEASGKPLSVRDALGLINQTLDEVLAEQEGDFDADSRWALSWFDHCGFEEGEYGIAETLSKAKNTSVQGLKDSGILDKRSPGGKVRLLRPNELPDDWDPTKDTRVSEWEMVHHLVRVLEGGGESAAAELVLKLGAKAEVARELAYRLYTASARKKHAQEALSYNGLVQSWPEITRLAHELGRARGEQSSIIFD